MNDNEAPSLEEIMTAWKERCSSVHCEGCKLTDFDSRYLCRDRYAYAVLTGKMKLSDSFCKDEPKPEPKLPAWCKEGRWVTESHPAHSLGYIDGIFSDRRIGVTWKHHKDGFTGSDTPAHTVKPVRFRPYTFEEARQLLGKVMEYQRVAGEKTICLIRDVTFNPFHPEHEVSVNQWEQEALINIGATIDGIPVGVPEVDEELLKGGQE